MRSLACLTLLASFLAVPLPASADDAAAPSATEARDHFRKGMRLYQDGDFAGALAEFQASYRVKPAGSTLQNIALCQKRLFRYVEAAESLDELLSRHSAEFDAQELEQVRRTQEELQGLIGAIELKLTPAHAEVTLDGRRLTPAERSGQLKLSVGEHRIRVESPGYTPIDQVVRVASGAPRKLTFSLTAVKGFLDIEADNPDAAIAVDGQPLAYHRYSGPVEPGRRRVQVYKDGHPTFEEVVEVELGKTTTVRATLGASDGSSSVDKSRKPPAPPSNLRGPYVLAALNLLNATTNPQFLEETSSESSGAALGLHGGYRLTGPIAVEGLFEVARHQATTCLRGQSCEGGSASLRDYNLSSLRFGGNMRLLSSGERLRFSGALGFGLVHQALKVDAAGGSAGGEATGVDPYFMVELGAQYSVGKVLFGLAVLAYFNSTKALEGDLGGGDDNPIYEDNGLVTAGLGLRIGWANWQPR